MTKLIDKQFNQLQNNIFEYVDEPSDSFALAEP
jgi:hypothetical protein